ncbi:MAG: hypothetical protein A2X49_12590 [Lentisphaerae bacterium GWF2_52_8]|nr:MAG: hypothetical protein A2X49_12590 [Lentisphaerae bacterium GWF2_52_8]
MPKIEMRNTVTELWDKKIAFPSPDEMPYPAGIRDMMVHRATPDYKFLHDAGIVVHKKQLFASWYNCPEYEMEEESIIRGRCSKDDGASWSEPMIIAADKSGKVLYVPSVFVPYQSALWAFVLKMIGLDLPDRLEAFLFDEETSQWISKGFIAELFLPNCPPVKMPDGNFIMPGRMADKLGEMPLRPAMAISQGANILEHWDIVPLLPAGEKMEFPESTLIADANELTAIIRPDHKSDAFAVVSNSKDMGRTWSPPQASNMPMSDSEPFAGILSSGQRYLISNTPGRPGPRRNLLTIAVSRPGEKAFSKIWRIRDGYSESLSAGPEWSYPCAFESDGKLYVAYTSEKHHCVLTIIPTASLLV